MSKLIALRSGFQDGMVNIWQKDFSSRLKQQALLFDQIGILQLNQLLKDISHFENPPSYIAPYITKDAFSVSTLDIKWLEENNIIFEPTIQDLFEAPEDEQLIPKYLEKDDEVNRQVKKFRGILNQIDDTNPQNILDNPNLDNVTVDEVVHTMSAYLERDSIVLRSMSTRMEIKEKVSVVTTLPYIEYTRKLPNSNKSDVAQVVINKLPLPNDETSWEQIIDYRNDPETQKHLLSLRKWISNISTKNLSSIEIEDELESLINDFQEHMKLHRMKTNLETLEVMVKAPLEILENLIKLRLSKIPEPLFALKKRQINLLEAELNAPGREISYIIKTQEAFQPNE